MPQLDSLRTFAVFFVLIEHWFQMASWSKILPFGMIGVTLFFVLSGFLITQILLNSRIKAEEKGEHKVHTLKQFYIRRTLRIFPIYYLTIFICYIINLQDIRDKFLWFLFYASNIYFYKINDWAGSLSHLWTLAVEEQFYIFWPFVILFVPKKYLLRSIIAILFFGPVFRSILFILNGSSEMTLSFINILTPSCMDCFGLGALMAYYQIFKKDKAVLKFRSAIIFLILNFVLIIILMFFEESVISVFFFRFCVSVICAFIIYGAINGYRGLAGRILDNTVLIFLGKISYGLYLYHNFIPLIYKAIGIPALSNLYLNFIVKICMLILISTVSWYMIEKPMNRLKKYFSYN